MQQPAIQDYYVEAYSHCYGCGRNNPQGHHLKSYWNGGAALARFTPGDEFVAVPGFVYGGLLASIIDCHGTATAAAAACHAKSCDMSTESLERFVTASLKVDFLLPTPTGRELELRGQAREIKERKIVVDVQVHVDGKQCVAGEVICVSIPETML